MNSQQEYEDIICLIKDPLRSSARTKLFEIKKPKLLKKWTKEEDGLLIELAKKYNSKCWKRISNYFEDKTPLQCFSRFKRIRPGIIKGSWSKEEDDKILEMVKIHGKSWSKISKILVSRNGKQIRDRFINILDPSIKKGKFSIEEDLKLLSLHRTFGTKWATISKFFENRTADMIKNRFHSSIKKNIKFLEDIEQEFTLSNIKKEFIFESSVKQEYSSSKDYNEKFKFPLQIDLNLDSDCNSPELNTKVKGTLIKENPINLMYLQTFCNSPNWHFEEFFVL